MSNTTTPTKNKSERSIGQKLLIAQVCVLVCCLIAYVLCAYILPPRYSDCTARSTMQMDQRNKSQHKDVVKDGELDILGYFSAKLNDRAFYQGIADELGLADTGTELRNRIAWSVSEDDPSKATIAVDASYGDEATAQAIAHAAADALDQLFIKPGPPPFRGVITDLGVVEPGRRVGPDTMKWVLIAFLVSEAAALIACFFGRQIAAENGKVYQIYRSSNDLEYLKLNKGEKWLYRLIRFFTGIPRAFKNLGLKIWKVLKTFGQTVAREIADIVTTFKNGDSKTRISYLVMGYGNIARGQVLRGLLFLVFEIVFIGYMILSGSYWLSMLPSLGKVGPEKNVPFVTVEGIESFRTITHDNSFKIMLYGVLTLFFIIAFLYTWRVNVKQNKLAEQILRSGKKLKSDKDDLRSMVDDQFHKTLLALPLTGIVVFTVMPIVFMILVAFTGYSGNADGVNNALFHWDGLKHFNTLLSWEVKSGSNTQSYAATFGEVLTWTLIWAFFATFTNYFLGMFVAMAINKKGIRFKKGWRTILVLTIAIPQFISLLYVSKMFAKNGLINGFLMDMGWITEAIDFFGDASRPWLARVTVIVINIWIGIPYLMLITTGILMNIPADLYESARIDGANAWQQYRKITLPYMLFVTGPYLLTSFTGNMNNFNVIYLLTGGGPTNAAASAADGTVGFTDLLITWLFKMTQGAEAKYYMASVVGILVFLVIAVISLVVYNLLPSIKNEEDFQ